MKVTLTFNSFEEMEQFCVKKAAELKGGKVVAMPAADDSEDEEEPAPVKKAAAPKAAKAAATKKASILDDEDEDEDEPAPVKKAAAPKVDKAELIKEMAISLSEADKHDGVIALLATYGVTKMSKLPKDAVNDVYEVFEKLLAADKPTYAKLLKKLQAAATTE